MRHVRWVAVGMATCGLAMAGPAVAAAGGDPVVSVDAAALPAPPNGRTASVATLRRAVSARVGPSYSQRVRTTVRPMAPFSGRITQLLVTRSVERDGDLWIEVMLPIRPNGSRGWIPADAVSLGTTPYRVEVDLSARRLTVLRASRRVLRVPIAIGAPGTPTPTGHFAIAEVVHTRTPGAFLGPIVLPLTGFSKTLNEFAGGDGRVALHGTSLPELIGTRASHGCVRLRNADIRRVARLAGPGTPVTIRR